MILPFKKTMETDKSLKKVTARKQGGYQPRSQSSSAISDVTSPVKLVGKIRPGRARFQASSGHSDSANRPGYEAGWL